MEPSAAHDDAVREKFARLSAEFEQALVAAEGLHVHGSRVPRVVR